MNQIIRPTESQEGNVGKKIPFYPKRTASWWSRLEDLQWPEKRARDMVRRRADAFAAADVDTVIQFGFHFRFDFAPYFGAMNGLFADICETLHERGIRFIDHYSCNLVARPNSESERLSYHTHQRHHVDLYWDQMAAETASYAGYRYHDLCEVDLVTGGRAYTPIYQAEMFCHNNPNFRAMHAEYLKRLVVEVPFDGAQTDDMCIYNFFRSCGCKYCRERFQREYGHELPPLTDESFWGKTSGELDLYSGTPGDPLTWGNYENPAFRDWVRMRYESIADHLRMVRSVIGPEKVLMTCCSSSAPQVLNALALSYEGNIDICDWVVLENCGLSAKTVNSAAIEPVAILQKSIAYTKPEGPAATVACSYTIYDDGAYLGWALARFWGVTNWICGFTTGLIDDPGDTKEEAELIAPYNNWERKHEAPGLATDVVDVKVAFLRANRDCGWRDENDVEYWEHVQRWALALISRNVGYRFMISKELEDSAACLKDSSPVVFDSCACVSDAEYANVKSILSNGGQVWIVAPFGTRTERGDLRETVLLDELKAGGYGDSLLVLDGEWKPEVLDTLIERGRCVPSITVLGENRSWRVRLRETERGYDIHLLNQDLEGIEHPTLTDRWGNEKVLQTIRSTASTKPLMLEVRLPGLGLDDLASSEFLSPELDDPRPLTSIHESAGKFSLEIDMKDIRMYGVVSLSVK